MSSDNTPRFGTGPQVYVENVEAVIRACEEVMAPYEKLKARAELLLIGLQSWRTTYVKHDDRARDIDSVFALREDAKKAGLFK